LANIPSHCKKFCDQGNRSKRHNTNVPRIELLKPLLLGHTSLSVYITADSVDNRLRKVQTTTVFQKHWVLFV